MTPQTISVVDYCYQGFVLYRFKGWLQDGCLMIEVEDIEHFIQQKTNNNKYTAKSIKEQYNHDKHVWEKWQTPDRIYTQAEEYLMTIYTQSIKKQIKIIE